MDLWTKLFLYLGASIAAVILLVALIMLSHADNGVLSLENIEHLRPQMNSFWAVFQWFVYVWMGAALVLFARFLMRLFGRR